jgi:predicted pyridoxine 5'-phosphate oxidase superfamily flavin-nucleotide-binding protein
MANDYEISSIEELVGVLGEPHAMIKEKVMNHLDEPMVEFINRSPLLFLSTQDETGLADVSPKGDTPGFVEVESSKQLLIPDRPGNKLAYGHKNILANNKVGLIFVVPNLRETLRVKGVARISRDPALLEKLANQDPGAHLVNRAGRSSRLFFQAADIGHQTGNVFLAQRLAPGGHER